MPCATCSCAQRAFEKTVLRGRGVVQRRPARAVHQALPGVCGDAEEVRGRARPIPPRLCRVRALQQRHQQRPHHLVPPGGGCRMQGRLAGGVARPRVRAPVEQQLCRTQAACNCAFAGFGAGSADFGGSMWLSELSEFACSGGGAQAVQPAALQAL